LAGAVGLLVGFGAGPASGAVAKLITATILTIATTDVGFRSSGCGSWTKIG
jgi:hypothetical protein